MMNDVHFQHLNQHTYKTVLAKRAEPPLPEKYFGIARKTAELN